MNLLLCTDFTIFLASLVCVECSPKGGGQIFGIPQLLLSPFEVTVVAAVRNKNLRKITFTSSTKCYLDSKFNILKEEAVSSLKA